MKDLAVELQLGTRAVQALIAAGEIPALRIGKRWYCRREALLARFRAVENVQKDRRRKSAVEVDRVVRALAPHNVGSPVLR